MKPGTDPLQIMLPPSRFQSPTARVELLRRILEAASRGSHRGPWLGAHPRRPCSPRWIRRCSTSRSSWPPRPLSAHRAEAELPCAELLNGVGGPATAPSLTAIGAPRPLDPCKEDRAPPARLDLRGEDGGGPKQPLLELALVPMRVGSSSSSDATSIDDWPPVVVQWLLAAGGAPPRAHRWRIEQDAGSAGSSSGLLSLLFLSLRSRVVGEPAWSADCTPMWPFTASLSL
ncbi:unnamed protein product [Urochloa humidicola]